VRRRSSASIAANPVLIGAATTLVIVVAVFLAYNANSGLPFVPTYSLKVDVPNAANLVVGNDVRLGGARVGVVDSIDPVNGTGGRVTARVGLKLETAVKPLPADSTFLIRSRSALGLKYVEITKGRSTTRSFADGAQVPLRQATPAPVEFDEFLSTFDDKTRAASRVGIKALGDGFAGRGASLNQAIGDLNPLLTSLVPVARNLADRRTGLGRLFPALDRTASQVAPVAAEQGQLFVNLDTTFKALAGVARPYLQDAITNGPPAEDAVIQNLPQQRPFLQNSTRFFAELRPGARALSTAAPDLADAFTTGASTLKRSVALNDRLKPTFESLAAFAQDPLVSLGVKDLTQTANILSPTIAYLKPTQTVCNYVTLFFRNAASLLSVGDTTGTGQRFVIIATPQGPNNEGGPSSGPANGPGDNYLHTNPYPNTAAPGQTKECEAANETFAVGKQMIGNVPGSQGTTVDKTKQGKLDAP
jgi:virulence factor Mce-like protein